MPLLNEETKLIVNGQNIAYTVATNSLQLFNTACQYFLQGNFEQNKNPILNLGIAKENYWVQWGITNNTVSAASIYINLQNPRLNKVQAYFVHTASLIVDSFTFGDLLPFELRPVYYNEFVLLLT